MRPIKIGWKCLGQVEDKEVSATAKMINTAISSSNKLQERRN